MIVTRIAFEKIKIETSIRPFWGGVGFLVRRNKHNKHRASVKGYSEIIKTCATTVLAPLGFMVRAKLTGYI